MYHLPQKSSVDSVMAVSKKRVVPTTGLSTVKTTHVYFIVSLIYEKCKKYFFSKNIGVQNVATKISKKPAIVVNTGFCEEMAAS